MNPVTIWLNSYFKSNGIFCGFRNWTSVYWFQPIGIRSFHKSISLFQHFERNKIDSLRQRQPRRVTNFFYKSLECFNFSFALALNRLRLQSIVDRKSHKAFSSNLVSRLGSYSNLLHTNHSILNTYKNHFDVSIIIFSLFWSVHQFYKLFNNIPDFRSKLVSSAFKYRYHTYMPIMYSLLFVISIFVWCAIDMQIHGNYSLMTDNFVTLPLGRWVVGQKSQPSKYWAKKTYNRNPNSFEPFIISCSVFFGT